MHARSKNLLKHETWFNSTSRNGYEQSSVHIESGNLGTRLTKIDPYVLEVHKTYKSIR